MKKVLSMYVLSVVGLSAACATHTRWSGQDGLTADKIELQVDARGRALEIEVPVESR